MDNFEEKTAISEPLMLAAQTYLMHRRNYLRSGRELKGEGHHFKWASVACKLYEVELDDLLSVVDDVLKIEQVKNRMHKHSDVQSKRVAPTGTGAYGVDLENLFQKFVEQGETPDVD